MSTKKKIIAIIIGIEAVIIAAMIAFLFYISSDTVRVNRQLELAQRYLLEEDYEQAIAIFEVVIEIDPKNAEAYLGLAEAYEATDDMENAVKILERGSRQTDSDDIRDLLNKYKEDLEQVETEQFEYRTEDTQIVYDTESQLDETPVSQKTDEYSADRVETIQDDDGYHKNIYDNEDKLFRVERYDNQGKLIQTEKYAYMEDGSQIISIYDSNKTKLKQEWYSIDGIYSYSFYDDSENVVRTEEYGADGSLNAYSVNSYDNDGRMIKDERYSADGSWREYHIYHYDSNGTRTEEWHSADNDWYAIYTYDSNGHSTKYEFYNTDGSLHYYGTLAYDSNGNLIRDEVYNADGSLDHVNVYDN